MFIDIPLSACLVSHATKRTLGPAALTTIPTTRGEILLLLLLLPPTSTIRSNRLDISTEISLTYRFYLYSPVIRYNSIDRLATPEYSRKGKKLPNEQIRAR
jgi:hypothetical protein